MMVLMMVLNNDGIDDGIDDADDNDRDYESYRSHYMGSAQSGSGKFPIKQLHRCCVTFICPNEHIADLYTNKKKAHQKQKVFK